VNVVSSHLEPAPGSRARVVRASAGDPLALPEMIVELEQRWLLWDRSVAGRRRVDVHPLLLSEEAHAEAVGVAERASALVVRAGERAAGDAYERVLYKLHPDVEQLAAAARSGRDTSALVRVDLLLRDDGRFVACEVNADCPGGHNETLALPRLARMAGFRGAHDPTTVAPRLADRLLELSGGPGSPRGAVGLVCATAYAEDLQVCALVERLVRERGGRAMRLPSTGPKESGDGVAYRGERIAVLYRFYPLEYMAGQANVAALARATERGELASVSAFSAVHAQSKLAMARAWRAEPDEARGAFPQTFAFRDVEGSALLRERAGWVVKRDLSRVGDDVVVGALETDESFRATLDEVAEGEADGEVWIAQRFVPPGHVATPWGPRCLTLGVYLLDGAFAGYLARLTTASHCSHDALVVPVFVAGEP
jgi:glutathionylspermidine synthase